MTYTVVISHDELIDLLQEYHDNKVYESIKDGDRVEQVSVGYADIFITIGKKENEHNRS